MKSKFYNKKNYLLLLLVVLGTDAHAQWWTDSMNINTGFKHSTLSVYTINCPSTDVDEYWSITKCPGLTSGSNFIPPFCAIPFTTNNTPVTQSGAIINPNISTTYRAISALCTQGSQTVAGPLGGVLWGCDAALNVQSPNRYLRFTRRFYVQDSTSVAINIIDGFADNYCRMAIDADSANPIPAFNNSDASFYLLSTYSTYQFPNIYNYPIMHKSNMLYTGWHSLDIDVYDVSGVEISLALTGYIQADFNKKIYYSPNNLCAEPAAPSPMAITNVDNNKNLFSIYPNPASTTFTVETHLPSTAKSVCIRIADLFGREIKQQKITNLNDTKIIIDLPNYISSNIYYCTLIVDGKSTPSQKITIVQ